VRLFRICAALTATLATAATLLLTPGTAAAQGSGCPVVTDAMDAWRAGTLRGANIWQGRLAPTANQFRDRDVGVPVTPADLAALRSIGANYVQLSVAGLFTEQAPYVVDPEVERLVDDLVAEARGAGLHVAIAFRSGPGRNEQALARNTDLGTYGPILETIWSDPAAQDGWMAMLRYAAQRYGDDPTVVGISPMLEPNSASRYPTLGPAQFFAAVGGTIQDVNVFQARARDTIRAVSDVPILIEGDGYGAVSYLRWLTPTGDDRSVYTAHFYEPFGYTHQGTASALPYPGPLPVQGSTETVDAAWIADALAPVGDYGHRHGVPMAVTEFGVQRYVPGAAAYLTDTLAAIDRLGVSRAVWEWVPEARRSMWNDFDVLGGPNPYQRAVVPNAMQTALALDYARPCTASGDAPVAAAPPAVTGTDAGSGDPTSTLLWVTGGAGALIVLLALLRPGRGSRRRRDRGELSTSGASSR
jgi:Cellulase (glycosyl hydrolase family 5)